MCDYCGTSKYDQFLFMEKTKTGSIVASIINSHIVVVGFVGEICSTVNKEINFCPMCGRKLNTGELS